MKKILSTIIIIIFLACPLIVNAAEGTITVTPNTIKVGVGKTAKITAKAIYATGDVKITSQDETIVKVTNPSNGYQQFADMTVCNDETQERTLDFTITGIKKGTATLTVVIDGADCNNTPSSIAITKEITVTVEEGNPSTGVSLTAVILTITALAGAAYVIRKNQTARFFG